MNLIVMSNPDSKTNAEAELLKTVLESELLADAPYPWQGAAALEYFARLEQSVPALEPNAAEAEQFFQRLDSLWAQSAPRPEAQHQGVALAQQLASRCIIVPSAIEAIAAQANALIGSSSPGWISLLPVLKACCPGGMSKTSR
ncbi:MAG: hypothetical protein HC824_19510 [Synechococcales cyanobacterium RM1_1_8]|nr:hypothetical protein [Synechococcales cyanobacterium RM1_1_8]